VTKFKDLNEDQRNALIGFCNLAVGKRLDEQHRYTNEVIKLLIFANGAGIALIASIMGAFVGSHQDIANWISPIWRFFAGCVMSSLIYGVLGSVSEKATQHVSEQVTSFYLNKIDVESVTGYGLNRIGRLVILILTILAFSAFVWGVYLSVQALKTLHG
jgi:hypothetical protein